jgi:uncharacterized Fe-S cluster protein YjdI
MTRKYSNGEITVVWQPDLCIHSAVCVGGLPQVFQPSNRPWVVIGAATSDRIVEQVNACPSGALSIERTGSG